MSRRGLLHGAAALASLGIAGCSSSRTTTAARAGTDSFTTLTYATSFGYFGRDSYAQAAQHLGYFRDEGLDVTIVQGQGAGDLVTKLSAGTIDFCSCDFNGFLLILDKLLARGQAPGLTAVAAIHQQSLSGIMSLEGRGISNPRDLVGRTIGDTQGSVNKDLFPTYAKLAGFDPATVRFVNILGPQLPATLAAGTVDAIGQFVVGVPTIQKAAAGRRAVVLPYSDVFRDLLGNVILTTTRWARQPDVVTRLTRALLKGLTFAIDNPAEAGKVLHRLVPLQDAAVAAEELRLMSAYVRPVDGQPLGGIDEQRVARNIAILKGAAAITSTITPAQVVSFDLAPTNIATKRGLDRD